MDNSDYFRRGKSEGVGFNLADHRAPYLSGVLPPDFPERLERLKEASELNWDAFADAVGIDRKRVHTWRRRKDDGKKPDRKPVKPDGGAFYALAIFALRVPGGIDILMGDGFQLYLWRDWQDRQNPQD